MLSLKMALRSIGANKMRAVLTMLGIIIGVLALVVLVSLVSSASDSITDSVSSLGNSLLTVAKEKEILEINVGSAPQNRFYQIGASVKF